MAKRKRGRGLMTLVKLLLLGAILFALAFLGCLDISCGWSIMYPHPRPLLREAMP